VSAPTSHPGPSAMARHPCVSEHARERHTREGSGAGPTTFWRPRQPACPNESPVHASLACAWQSHSQAGIPLQWGPSIECQPCSKSAESGTSGARACWEKCARRGSLTKYDKRSLATKKKHHVPPIQGDFSRALADPPALVVSPQGHSQAGVSSQWSLSPKCQPRP